MSAAAGAFALDLGPRRRRTLRALASGLAAVSANGLILNHLTIGGLLNQVPLSVLGIALSAGVLLTLAPRRIERLRAAGSASPRPREHSAKH